MTEPQYTYGDLTYESVTIVARGGSVPGPRHLILTLEAGDAQAPGMIPARARSARVSGCRPRNSAAPARSRVCSALTRPS